MRYKSQIEQIPLSERENQKDEHKESKAEQKMIRELKNHTSLHVTRGHSICKQEYWGREYRSRNFPIKCPTPKKWRKKNA